jgi:hypothetical protein
MDRTLWSSYRKIISAFVVLLILASGLQAWGQNEATINRSYSHDKNRRILFDEGHHNFHTSTGRYKPFADVLTKDGYIIIPNKQKITPEILIGYDVFVCSNASSSEPDSLGRRSPLPAFTAEEGQYLKQWVLNGGSMWLIADHEPAGNAVENLADSFDVNMSKSYTADPKNFDKISLYASWIRYSIENVNLGDHPIMKGRNESERIRTLVSFTGQSLKGSENSVPLLLLSDQAYNVINIEDRLNAQIFSAKGRCQALAMEFGKGRIVICGEAAMFTSLKGPGMNFPGTDNKQFLLNIAHWLSKLI